MAKRKAQAELEQAATGGPQLWQMVDARQRQLSPVEHMVTG